ncbi:7109_t:CDS:2, partial [Cetraspora pellucida]
LLDFDGFPPLFLFENNSSIFIDCGGNVGLKNNGIGIFWDRFEIEEIKYKKDRCSMWKKTSLMIMSHPHPTCYVERLHCERRKTAPDRFLTLKGSEIVCEILLG